ncbi:MAG TPA: hypothetical protein VF719_08720 [Abditibacteriaceae bacterium]|jgi:hypothetical protein
MNEESCIDEVRNEVALLKVKHNALLKSHRKLVLTLLGDTEEAAALLNEIDADVVENYPEQLKQHR